MQFFFYFFFFNTRMQVRVVSGVDNFSSKDFDCVIVLTSSAEDIQGTPFDDDIKRLLQVRHPP